MQFDSPEEKEIFDEYIEQLRTASGKKDSIIHELMQRCTELESEIKNWRDKYYKVTGRWN